MNVNKSIWGIEDKDTLDILGSISISGDWLNLAAGDGRYNNILLEKVNKVTVSDIDKLVIDKLINNTSEKYKYKLYKSIFDMTTAFPFKDKSFDGVFCTGTLHLFPKNILLKVISEVKRVLKPNGLIILDFAIDIKRITEDGKYISMVENEPKYSLEEGLSFLNTVFKNYKLEIHKCRVPKEFIDIGEVKYLFTCNYLLLLARYKSVV